MTLKELRQYMEKQERLDAKTAKQLSSTELTPEVLLLLKRYKNRQFFCGKLEDPNPKFPCFNHAIGLPRKSNKDQPLHDYQLEIVDMLEGTNIAGKNPSKEVEHFIFVKKAVGIGLSELMLRWIAYCGVCHNDKFAFTKCFLTCGPAERTALELADRLRGLLRALGCPSLIIETDRTICKFANFYVSTIPSNNLDRLRGWTNVSMIISDEADFYSMSEGESLREICEYYPSKCPGVFIALVSSANLPGGLFQRIEEDPKAIYRKIFIPWRRALGKIYSIEEIAQAQRSSGFERNFNLHYGFGISNVFLESSLNKCIVDYPEPTREELANSVISIGCDEGWGSSKFGLCATAFVDTSNKIKVLAAVQYSRISFTHSVDIVLAMMKQYGYSLYNNNVKLFVDSSRPDFVRDVCAACGLDPAFEAQLDYARHNKLKIGDLTHVIPVSFGTEGKNLLAHTSEIISDCDLEVAPRFHDLCLQLRIARTKPSGMLDKTQGNTLDLLEALELSLYNWDKNSKV